MNVMLSSSNDGAPAEVRQLLVKRAKSPSTKRDWYAEADMGAVPRVGGEVFRHATDAARRGRQIHIPTSAPHQDYSRFHEDIARLRQLKANWNGYGSESPNAVAAEHARRILDELSLHAREPDRIVASAENGIGVYITGRAKYAIIECFNDGDIVVGVSDRRGHIRNWNLPPEPAEIKQSLEEILVDLDD